MIPVPGKYLHSLSPLFKEVVPHTLVDSVLQGHMGEAWSDKLPAPETAIVKLSDFFLLGGKPSKVAIPLLNRVSALWSEIIAPPGLWWETVKTGLKADISVCTRFSFSHKSIQPANLNRFIKGVTGNISISQIDRETANILLQKEWSMDLVSNFDNIDNFLNRGLGFVVRINEQIVSGASSFSVFNGGIEVEIDTHPEYRNNGFATIAGAQLIRECFNRNIIPHWDAMNETSAHLAKKLGYTLTKSYEVMRITS